MTFDWMKPFRSLLRFYQRGMTDVAYARFLKIHRRKLQRVWEGESSIAHDTVRTSLNSLDLCFCAVCERACPNRRHGNKPGNQP